MTRRRAVFASLSLPALLLVSSPALFSQAAGTAPRQAAAAPAQASPRLTDQELWKLATDYSEPDGTFHSENLVSNEARFQTILPALDKRRGPGPRVRRRRLRAELHLHRRDQTVDGVHRRYPARQPRCFI